MQNTDNNKSLRGLFITIGSAISAVIAFVITVVSAIRLFQDNTNLVTFILLVVGVCSLWMVTFFVYFKKKGEYSHIVRSPDIRDHVFVKSPFYPRWMRYIALTCIFLIPALALGGYLTWKSYKERDVPPEKLIILIANFEGIESQNYRVTETIIEQLREATQKYDDVSVEALNEVITAQEGSQIARQKGKKRKAGIVLWGWYGKTGEKVFVTVHFEVIQKPRFLPLLQDKEVINVAVAEMESFAMQTRLSSEMTYLTLFTIGLIRFEAEDHDGAIDCFNNALDQKNIPEQMVNPEDLYFYRGAAYLIKRDAPSAILDFTQTMKSKPTIPEAYINRASAFALLNKYDEAITDLNRIIELEPDSARGYNYRGVSYLAKGDYENAINDFQRAISFNSKYYEVYGNLGRAYRRKGDYYKAIANYNQALDFSPNDALLYNNRGVAHSGLNNHDQAIADFSQAIKIKPNNALYYFNRSASYLISKDKYHLGIADLDKVIKLEPENALAYTRRGAAYLSDNKHENAFTDIENAISLNPNLAEAHFQRGLLYLDKSDFESALENFNHAIFLKPLYADAYHNRARTFSKMGDSTKAIADFNQAIKLEPYNADFLNNRAVFFADLGQVGFALADYKRAIELEPNTALHYFNRGVLYFNKAEFNRAINDFSEVIRIEPNNEEAYLWRGSSFHEKDDNKRALDDLNFAISLKPNFPEALNFRASILSDNNSYDLALTDLEQAIKFKPDFAVAYFGWAVVYLQKNFTHLIILDPKLDLKAMPEYIKALNHEPTIYKPKVSIHQALNYLDKAIELDIETLKNQDSDRVLNNIVWQLAMNRDRLEDALLLLRRCLIIDPENADNLDTLAEIYFRLGRFTEAKSANEEASKLATTQALLNSLQERASKIDKNFNAGK